MCYYRHILLEIVFKVFLKLMNHKSFYLQITLQKCELKVVQIMILRYRIGSKLGVQFLHRDIKKSFGILFQNQFASETKTGLEI